MQLHGVGIRINFHDATDEQLRTLGVDRGLVPSRTDWRRPCETDYARPIPEGDNYALVWELDRDVAPGVYQLPPAAQPVGAGGIA
jgi:hypothetical protein